MAEWFYHVLTAILRRGLFINITKRFSYTGFNMPTYKYFSPREIQGLDRELVAMLDNARGLSGVPFIITSGLRSKTENEMLPEAVNDSSHLTGNAVDLACSDSGTRYHMLTALLNTGFNRVGIYANHIHADNSTTRAQQVIWHSSYA